MARGIQALALILIVAAGVAVAADDLPRWGVGWLGLDRAPTFRVRLGEWQVGVAARPDDDLSYAEDWNQGDEVHDVPSDMRTESGWVRLDVGRCLRRWETVELPVLAAFSYDWRDSRNQSRFWSAADAGYQTVTTDLYDNSYELTLALRPTWRIRRWVAIELEFGLRYEWSNSDRFRSETRPDLEEPSRTYTEVRSHSFSEYGPSSRGDFGIFNLIFWF